MTVKFSALPAVTTLISTDIVPVVAGGVTSKITYGNLVTQLIEGLEWKDNAKIRSGVNVNLAAPGANLDGIAMVAGDRFLAPLQTAPAEGGIYVWNGAAVPATRSLDADTATELLNATLSIDLGTYAGTTWRQTATNITLGVTAITFTIFGSGDIVGPGSATDNAVATFSGTTGKLLQNSLAILSVAGALLLPAGTAALPAFSPLANAGLYSTGANALGLSTNSTLRLTIDTAAVTSTLPYVGPAGAGTVPGYAFIGATTTGLYTTSGYTGFVSAGADAALIGITSGNATFQGRVGDAWFTTAVNNAAVSLRASNGTGLGPAIKFINASTWTHAGTAAIMAQFAQTVNQSVAAGSAYTILDFAITETQLGGTATNYLINAKAGAAGTTQVFAVTNSGVGLFGSGTAGNPAISFVTFPTVGFRATSASAVVLSLAGAAYWQFNQSGSTAQLSSLTATTDTYINAGNSGTSARLVLLSAAGGTDTYSIAQVAVTCNTAWTGSSVEQKQFGIYSGVNQTGTASLIALDINATSASLGGGTTAPVFGSGGGYAIKVRVGGTSPVEKFSVTFNGGIGVVSVNVTMAAAENNNTTIGTYGVARVTSNGAGTVLTGITAPLDARELTLVHVAGLTLTINNQDALSTAANRIITGTGAALVLAVDSAVTLWYDLTTARWRVRGAKA